MFKLVLQPIDYNIFRGSTQTRTENVGLQNRNFTFKLWNQFCGLSGTRIRFFAVTVRKDNPYPNRPNLWFL